MKNKVLILFSLILIMTGQVLAQSIAGNYDMSAINLQYVWVCRDSASAADTAATYDVTASWPSSATPMYTRTLKTFTPGDTMATPGALLPDTTYLQMMGIDMNVTLDDAGNMILDGTYPTSGTVNCSSSVVVAAVSENGTFEMTSNTSWVDNVNHTITFGWGIVTSGIFAHFQAPLDIMDPSTYGWGTDMPNWGKMIVQYTDDFSDIISMNIIWEAHDGVASSLGIDEAGEFERHLGVPVVDGDTVTVGYLQLAVQDPNWPYGQPVTPLNAGNMPIIGGAGQDLDGDGIPDGLVKVNWGYLFDPKGADGVPFSGDEPLQFTGYYFTKNFLTAAGAMSGYFENESLMTALVTEFMTGGMDQVSATVAAADSIADLAAQSVALAFNLDAASAAAIGAAVGASVSQALNDYLTGGGTDLPTAIADAAAAAAVTTLGGLAQAGVTVDDSDHDCVYPFNGNGRLIFEVDNNCIPNFSSQYLDIDWVETGWVGIESDDSVIPDKFALYDNYPNPFNPVTTINFDLPQNLQTEVTVWNLLGQRIATIYAGELRAGQHSLTFDGQDAEGNLLPSGVYLYRVKAGEYHSTKKMMLLK